MTCTFFYTQNAPSVILTKEEINDPTPQKKSPLGKPDTIRRTLYNKYGNKENAPFDWRGKTSAEYKDWMGTDGKKYLIQEVYKKQ